jgi:hypothetical protein
MAEIDPKTKKHIELRPNAWERFERAVDVVARSPPQHKTREKLHASQKSAGKKRRKQVK